MRRAAQCDFPAFRRWLRPAAALSASHASALWGGDARGQMCVVKDVVAPFPGPCHCHAFFVLTWSLSVFFALRMPSLSPAWLCALRGWQVCFCCVDRMPVLESTSCCRSTLRPSAALATYMVLVHPCSSSACRPALQHSCCSAGFAASWRAGARGPGALRRGLHFCLPRHGLPPQRSGMPLRERRRAHVQPLRPGGQLLQARTREVGRSFHVCPGRRACPQRRRQLLASWRRPGEFWDSRLRRSSPRGVR